MGYSVAGKNFEKYPHRSANLFRSLVLARIVGAGHRPRRASTAELDRRVMFFFMRRSSNPLFLSVPLSGSGLHWN